MSITLDHIKSISFTSQFLRCLSRHITSLAAFASPNLFLSLFCINAKLENTRSISLGVWREMIRAVGENKPAEAIILSLIAMGENGPGGLDAAGVSTTVRLLRSVGLDSEARDVVLEALVSNGF